MSALDDLLDYLFDAQKPSLYNEFQGWVLGSRRFRAFALTYRGKIHAKLRSVRDDAGMKDLRAELETALLLLRDERFTVEYEKYTASRQRGPDFTVTYKTHTPFNVEVRRIRTIELDDAGNEARVAKLMAVLCEKVGQIPPSIANLLWLVTEREVTADDLTAAAATLRQLAERKTEDFFTRRGFESAADYLRHYQRLSGIVVRHPGQQVIWLNPLARHRVPPEIVNSIRRLSAT